MNTAENARTGLDHLYAPLSPGPRDPKAWRAWWENSAKQPVDDYLGLKKGDELTVQWAQSDTIAATVISTHAFGALVLCPWKPEPFEMWVRHRNHLGNWYR